MKIKSFLLSIVFVLLFCGSVFATEGDILESSEILNNTEDVVEVNSELLTYKEIVDGVISALNKRDSYYFEISNPIDSIEYLKIIGFEVPEDVNKEMTRIEFVVLLCELCEKVGHQPNYSTDLISVSNVFTDISELSESEVAAIETVFTEGLMGGKIGNVFEPNSILTETELSFVLERLEKGYSREKLFNVSKTCFTEEARLNILEKYGFETDKVMTKKECLDQMVVFGHEGYYISGDDSKIVLVSDILPILNVLYKTPGSLFKLVNEKYYYLPEDTSFVSAEEWEYLESHINSEIKLSEFLILYDRVIALKDDMKKLEGFDSWEEVLEYSGKYLGFIMPLIENNKDCFTYFLGFGSDDFKIVPYHFARTVHECQHEEFLSIAGASFSRKKTTGPWGTWSISPRVDPKTFYYYDYINGVWSDSKMLTELPNTEVMFEHYPEEVKGIGSIAHYASNKDSSANDLGVQGLLSEFCSFAVEAKVNAVSYCLGMNSTSFESIDYDGYRQMELMVKDYLLSLKDMNPELYSLFMQDSDVIRTINNILKDMDFIEELHPYLMSISTDKRLLNWESVLNNVNH